MRGLCGLLFIMKSLLWVETIFRGENVRGGLCEGVLLFRLCGVFGSGYIRLCCWYIILSNLVYNKKSSTCSYVSVSRTCLTNECRHHDPESSVHHKKSSSSQWGAKKPGGPPITAPPPVAPVVHAAGPSGEDSRCKEFLEMGFSLRQCKRVL